MGVLGSAPAVEWVQSRGDLLCASVPTSLHWPQFSLHPPCFVYSLLANGAFWGIVLWGCQFIHCEVLRVGTNWCWYSTALALPPCQML